MGNNRDAIPYFPLRSGTPVGPPNNFNLTHIQLKKNGKTHWRLLPYRLHYGRKHTNPDYNAKWMRMG